ncbi:Hypothetical protein SMAX5B_018861, partial [Scophthalmus maximus]
TGICGNPDAAGNGNDGSPSRRVPCQVLSWLRFATLPADAARKRLIASEDEDSSGHEDSPTKPLKKLSRQFFPNQDTQRSELPSAANALTLLSQKNQ